MEQWTVMNVFLRRDVWLAVETPVGALMEFNFSYRLSLIMT